MATQDKTASTTKPRKPRTSNVPKDETKAQKFVRLGQQRTTKAVKALRNLAKLGGNGYERTPEQIAKIGELLEAEVTAIKKALAPQVKAEKGAVESVITL